MNPNCDLADVLFGLAYFRAQEGNRDLALIYAKQLRELDPENAEYARMVDVMDKSPPR